MRRRRVPAGDPEACVTPPGERRRKSDLRKRLGAKLSDAEVKEIRRVEGIRGGKARMASLTPKERTALAMKGQAGLSPEAKARWRAMVRLPRSEKAILVAATGLRRYWEALTPKAKAARMAKTNRGRRRWWKTITPEERAAFVEKIKAGQPKPAKELNR